MSIENSNPKFDGVDVQCDGTRVGLDEFGEKCLTEEIVTWRHEREEVIEVVL